MESRDDQLRELEAELQRVYGGTTHVNVAGDPTQPWPEADVARALSILRSLPDGAGEAAVIRAFGIRPDQIWRRDAPS
jgi:hypothetical protein